MDQADTAVLAECDARARDEQELMREVTAGTGGRRSLRSSFIPPRSEYAHTRLAQAGFGAMVDFGVRDTRSTLASRSAVLAPTPE